MAAPLQAFSADNIDCKNGIQKAGKLSFWVGCADAPGPSGLAAPQGPAMAARHVATLDVLLKEMLTERSTAAAAAPFTVADVMSRLARANLAFPENAVVQVRTGEDIVG